ncbi:MAG: hypothetical protein IJI42_01690 [Methanobrevibacter sp.]|nr:hypothetical protein [Methanobrevibacter sp.]
MKGISTKSIVSAAGTAPLPFSSAPAAAGYRNLQLIEYVLDVLAPEFYKKGLVPEDCFPLFDWSCVHSPDNSRTLFVDAVFMRLANQHYYFVVKSNDPYL